MLGAEHDRVAVRGYGGGAFPGVAVAGQRLAVGDALFGDQSFERVQPVPVIGLARIGVARRLGALDLVGQGRGPFAPGEQATLVQRQRHREGLRLPRLTEDRALLALRDARHRERGRGDGVAVERAHAGSRYGSNASIDTVIDGSASLPHSLRPLNTTV